MTTVPQETFASLLRTYRQQWGFTQSQLAARAEYDRSYISYLERGLRNPTREVVLTLAGVLELGNTERNKLLLSARFAAEDPEAGALIDLSDPLVASIAQLINELAEPRRSAFREELALIVDYLRFRHGLVSAEDARAPQVKSTPANPLFDRRAT